MSRIAEASARAGRAVPDNSGVNWAKEREAAEDLLSGTALSGTAPEQAVGPSRPAIAPPRSVDSIEQTFPWPPKFDLDEIDLSVDTNASGSRRSWTRTQPPLDQRRLEFEDQTPGRYSQVRDEAAAVPQPRPPRQTAAPARRVAEREPARAEPRRVTLRWVVIAMALAVAVAAGAFLMYLLR